MTTCPETRARLRRMAQRALAARDAGDPRWNILTINLALQSELPMPRVIEFIEQLASE